MNDKGNNVLLVEDDDITRAALTFKLGMLKIGVDAARNGIEALDDMRARPYKLVLLDLRLPVKDGFQVLEEMAADPQLKNNTVWAMSNLGQKDEIDRAIALGAKEYFIKADMDINEFARKIAAVASGSGGTP